MWASFTPAAVFTVPVAAHLVNFAQVRAGETVLDIGTGTGVVAICAARAGAQVTGLDLTPALLDVARENARISRQSIVWTEGDAEQLPCPDATFDVVLSQFGHIFAPRPDKAIAEMRRVLKPSGRLAFATWPPEHFVGRMFALVAKNSPPPPAGTSPPFEWGIPARIGERLAAGFAEPFYARGEMRVPALSLEHFRAFMGAISGPHSNACRSTPRRSRQACRIAREV